MALIDITEHVVGVSPELAIPHHLQSDLSQSSISIAFFGEPYWKGTITYGIRDDLDREDQLLPMANPRDTYLIPLYKNGITAPDENTGVKVTSGNDGVLALSAELPDRYGVGDFFRVGSNGRMFRLRAGAGTKVITVEPDTDLGTGDLLFMTRLEVVIIGSSPQPFDAALDLAVSYNWREKPTG